MTLTEAKARYKKCKSVAGKRKAFNIAMLNLSAADQQAFYSWYCDYRDEMLRNGEL